MSPLILVYDDDTDDHDADADDRSERITNSYLVCHLNNSGIHRLTP